VPSDGSAQADDDESLDAWAAVPIGVRGQHLILEGWFASHADSGRPGPHVALRLSASTLLPVCAAAADPSDSAAAVAAALGIDKAPVLGYLDAFSFSRLTGRQAPTATAG